MLMATVNSSIVLISLPAIFRGIKLNPLVPSNVSYLLWMIMGYMVVTAVLVVSLGRIGDMFGRVRLYNLGFLVFTVGSILLSLVFTTGPSAALELILFRLIQGVGGAMIFACSTAILTDAFPQRERGMALGINAVAAVSGSFIGLIVGGLLSTTDWHLVFLVSVPVGLFGTAWAYLKLRETGIVKRSRVDWWGNVLFAVGLISVLVGITYGIQPYGTHSMGWTNPSVLTAIIGGVALLVVFVIVETRVAEPMFRVSLFRLRGFTFGTVAALLSSIGRGGLMFMVIIWLQGIWLPLHGYSYESTPFWAAIFMLPLTAGFLIGGPIFGLSLRPARGARLCDRRHDLFGDRLWAAHAAAGQLLLPAVRAAALPRRPVDGNVRRAQHRRRDERGAGRSPRCCVGHARNVPEQRHDPVDRHLLLADDRGTQLDVALDDVRRAHRARRSGDGGASGGEPAAGGIALRGVPRIQPDDHAARTVAAHAAARVRPRSCPARRSFRT